MGEMKPINKGALEPILLRDSQVAYILGVHRNTIWNRVRSGKFPKPIKWEGITVWRRSDIEQFIESLAG